MTLFRMSTAGWVVALLLMAGSACAQQVQVMKPLKNLKGQTGTYSWRPTRDASEPALRGWVHTFVDKDLQAKGWRLVAARGDFTVDVTEVEKTILAGYTSGYGGSSLLDDRRPSATWGSQRSYLASSSVGSGEPSSEGVGTVRTRIFTLQIFDGRGKKKLFKAPVLDGSRDRDSVVAHAGSAVDAVLAPFPGVHRVGRP